MWIPLPPMWNCGGHNHKFALSRHFLSCFFVWLRRCKKMVGSIYFYSLFTNSLSSKQEKYNTPLLFLSSLTLSSLILSNQTECYPIFDLKGWMFYEPLHLLTEYSKFSKYLFSFLLGSLHTSLTNAQIFFPAISHDRWKKPAANLLLKKNIVANLSRSAPSKGSY